ncbi:MAG TPA: chloride channel protein [Spirochaetota bacterium]|nr:chloride channel protein [Spirochaetota bacterium]HOF00142.1 chloride channel protein [Spirochaetota bacterium]HOS32143.1 chloride channel protein [Spirochaetota bacterium]HOS54581.1 chloride channel protein [Spirochaetota bacterium]HPK60894.1 chloride channel protein [Spirochaetota bacterium]
MQSLLVGLAAGFTVILYRVCIEKADEYRDAAYIFLKNNNFIFTVFWILLLLGIGLTLGFILKKEPLSGGSGIPQIKGILSYQVESNWIRTLISKFIGGVLAIVAGLSLGREGPSIQLGASCGEGINKLFAKDKLREKYLITAGASAGLSAAFNAPLAGIIFSLEELHKNFSPYVLLSSATASLTADFIAQNIIGIAPIFSFTAMKTIPFSIYSYLILLGILMGILGTIFNLSIIGSMKLYEKLKFIPQIVIPIIPILFALVFGFILPEILGGGHILINNLTIIDYGLKILVVLFISKYFLTIASFGSGAPGGIFLPLLCIGAIFGAIYGDILCAFKQIDQSYIKNFIALAMSAYFSAIVKAPITGSILITEMTGSFNHLFPFMTVSMVAYLTSDILKTKPIYDVLLYRLLKKRSDVTVNVGEENKIILEIQVSIGSKLSNKRINEIDWPPDTLIVGMKRGDNEVIPKGNTIILPNDYLMVLTSLEKAGKVNKEISSLAEEMK